MKNITKILSGSLAIFCISALSACATAPHLDSQKIRPWSEEIASEYPGKEPAIAHYKKDNIELFYLAARHTSTMGDDTLNLVQQLFDQFKFNAVLIESIPYSAGESPKWFLAEAQKGRTNRLIVGGESAFAAILADEKKIPFFAGEPDHLEIFNTLKAKGYTDEDILGFYVVRQIPQWIREGKNKDTLLKKEVQPFLVSYCKQFSLSRCPTLNEVTKWYKSKVGRTLSTVITNEDTAPYPNGALLTQRMAAAVSLTRDQFTLEVIDQLLRKYKKIAIVYGAGHFFTLRKSFDAAFGTPTFIVDVK